jgi:hypothetical protein
MGEVLGMGTVVVALALLAVVMLIRVLYLLATRPCLSGLHRHRHWRRRRYDGR